MANGGAPPSVPLLGEHKIKPEVKDEPKVKEEPEDDDDDDVDGVPMEDDKVAEQAKLKHHTIPGKNHKNSTFGEFSCSFCTVRFKNFRDDDFLSKKANFGKSHIKYLPTIYPNFDF